MRIAEIEVAVGQPVLEAEGEEFANELFGNVARALALIGQVDPRLLTRIRRDVRLAFIWFGPHCGYWPASNTILLGSQVVKAYDAIYLASVFVHEATHARLHRRGIRTWPDLEARIERRCLLEQIGFVERVRGGESLATYLRQWLDRPWWTPEQLAKRGEEAAREVERKLHW